MSTLKDSQTNAKAPRICKECGRTFEIGFDDDIMGEALCRECYDNLLYTTHDLFQEIVDDLTLDLDILSLLKIICEHGKLEHKRKAIGIVQKTLKQKKAEDKN